MWDSFATRHALTDKQLELFKRFYNLLKEYNEVINLTAIDQPQSIIAHHFDDSLALYHMIDLSAPLTLADVGTGGGFPGIPLKIVFPHLMLYLIEVSEKKISYLTTVIDELALDNVVIVPLDWRTFLRKTALPIDIFCARASLAPEELLRMFKPASPYKQSMLVYWASRHFKPSPQQQEYVTQEYLYTVGSRARKLLLFQAPHPKDNL